MNWTRRVIRAYYQHVAKPIFFRLDPEKVHDRITAIGKRLGSCKFTRYAAAKVLRYQDKSLELRVAGLDIINPVGLSAGFDKDANLIGIMGAVGFGFVEVGTVTSNPYSGNPRPRLYRLPRSKGIVVNYGLKNVGVDKVVRRLARWEIRMDPKLIVGASVGKTNSPATVDEAAGIADYAECYKRLQKARMVKYFTINISCPNTFGGEPFTTAEKLDKLLVAIRAVRDSRPLFVKMPINLPWGEMKRLVETVIAHGVEGVIIGNLNKDRSQDIIFDPLPDTIKGGISGKPTQALSNQLIEAAYREYGNKLVIVGVGGIFSAEDAYAKIRKGASLVQLITGMIFEGPQLIGDINAGLAKLLKRDGYKNIAEAVGCEVK